MADAAPFVLVLLFAIGGGLLVYALVDAETEDRDAMDRATAERVVRRDEDEE